MESRLPTALLNTLESVPGFDKAAFLNAHTAEAQITSVRKNPAKPSEIFENVAPAGWSSMGSYLQERPLFTADPLFHAGCYYVQEASSMFLEQALRQGIDLNQKLNVLDLCAAPGGKSTLIASLISDESLLVSNELIKSRVPVLCDNLIKWGNPNTYVSNNDPRDFERLPAFFDVVVVDAPCSGSGLFRKDPDAINEWSEDNVNLCSQRQQRILADVYPALKKDGLLIYSTCSYSEAENEAIADWLSEEFEVERVRIPIQEEWGIVETESPKAKNWGYRFYPNRLKGEGFFLAAFRKRDGVDTSDIRIKKQEPIKIPSVHIDEIQNWISKDTTLTIRPFQDGYLGIPKGQENELLILQEKLYLKKSGVRLGKFAGKDFIPDHDLALSLIASPTTQRLHLNREEAISYLKKEDLKIESGLKGWALVCYEGFPLGWAKVLPNRINNYYPANWRIFNQAIK